ncbi:MAG: hypothetical protein JW811_05815 [Clostridiales bacterium]|nr:hypothetical protein [Clostridiales bacterium]
MSRLENLKEIADRNLGGLKADTRLLHQILNSNKETPERKFKWRPVLIASAAAAVLLVTGLIMLPQLLRGDGDLDVVSRTAGGDGVSQEVQLSAYVPAGSVSISESFGGAPSYHNLFAAGQNADFPLVKVGNATYRMLTDAVTASSGQLGGQLGSVTEYTVEPAVSSGGIVSNIVAAGQPVYAVQGMDGALIAVEVQGTLRVFQRASYGGMAIVGGETLRDVLTGSVGVAALELSDVGRIDQPDTVQALMDVLYAYAHYEGAAESANFSQSLLLTLSNGLSVQMNAENGMLSACGTWSCPEFYDAFMDAMAD